MRALLEAFRDGIRRAAAPRRARDGFEPAIDRLARLFGLSRVRAAAAAARGRGRARRRHRRARRVAAGRRRPAADLRPRARSAAAARTGTRSRRARRSAAGGCVELGRRADARERGRSRIDERVLHYLTGLDAPDERLDGVVRARGRSAAARAVAAARSPTELARDRGRGRRRASLVRLDGDDVEARLGVAQALAADARARTHSSSARAALPPAGPDLAALARLVDREALLVDGAAGGRRRRRCRGVDRRAPRRARGAGRRRSLGESAARASGRVALHRTVRLPSPAEARALWAAALGEPVAARSPGRSRSVAQHFRLGAAAVDAVARELAATARPPTRPRR